MVFSWCQVIGDVQDPQKAFQVLLKFALAAQSLDLLLNALVSYLGPVGAGLWGLILVCIHQCADQWYTELEFSLSSQDG